MTAVLQGWTERTFAAAGVTHQVYGRGSGPGVVLLPELPGATPQVLALGERLVASGFTVEIPSLVGTPGRPLSAAYAAAGLAKVCVSREFLGLARGARRPVADYVRALAADLAARTPGAGVGVVGMCFSGGFALAAAASPAVLAAVASQPSVPLPLGAARKRDPGLSPGELAVVAERTRDVGPCVLGLRFTADPISPADRFATLREALGDGFLVTEVDSSPGNAAGISKRAHSVICSDLVDEPGHPTRAALDEVLAFLHDRLDGARPPG